MNAKDATAKRIEQLCKERGIAYNELANICGVTPSTSSLSVASNPSQLALSTVKKICDGFELTLSDFFSSSLFDNLEQELR